MSEMICASCGAAWSLSAIDADTSRFYFASSSGELEKPTSVAEIHAAGLTMVECPKDPLLHDPSMGALDLNTGLQPGRAPDSGERSPGPGDSDATHPPEDE